METIHNLCTALNVKEKVRPYTKEYRIVGFNDWHAWECPCRDDRVLLRRRVSPGKLFFIWRKEEDNFIDGDQTCSRRCL